MNDKAQPMLIHGVRVAPRRNAFVLALAGVAFLYIAITLTRGLLFPSSALHNGSTSHGSDAVKPDGLVPFEVHIMSKCPDAQVCLRDLVIPAMQLVSPKVEFKLSYIGTATSNDGVDCMHGPSECLGNILELCAAKLYPEPKIYLGFTMCLTFSYADIPDRDLVEGCALEHGVDFEALNTCSSEDSGSTGLSMLRDSVKWSKANGVTKSCTVRLNNEIYCIHDGRWIDCPTGPGVNDLVIAIEKLYRSS